MTDSAPDTHGLQDHERSTVTAASVDLAAHPVTNDRVDPTLCTLGGVSHDFRPRTYERYGKPHTSWVCVWCNAVACGDYDEADPCMEVYHHSTPHRTRLGVSWPVGGWRNG